MINTRLVDELRTYLKYINPNTVGCKYELDLHHFGLSNFKNYPKKDVVTIKYEDVGNSFDKFYYCGWDKHHHAHDYDLENEIKIFITEDRLIEHIIRIMLDEIKKSVVLVAKQRIEERLLLEELNNNEIYFLDK